MTSRSFQDYPVFDSRRIVTALLETKGTARPDRLISELDQVYGLVESSIGTNSVLCGRLRTLRERLQHKRLQIAVLGQFKRGKSTFVNALLGAPVLPTAVVPLTAIPTFIAWGNEPRVQVQFAGGKPPEDFAAIGIAAIRDVLSRFVTEEANPKNCLRVERVDLFYPADVLSDGTVLIDTPGIGSTLAHNTEAALRVLPECDASLFIVSADPPITEVELAYLHRLKPKVGRTFFVINKIDYLTNDEQRSLTGFLRGVLTDESLIDPETPIFRVSARLGLAAKEAENSDALKQSGMADIEDYLKRYLATEKAQSLDEAIRRKAAEVLALARAEVELRARTLRMPLEDLERRSSEFVETLRSLEGQRLTNGDLLAGDRRRLANDLEARTEALREDALVTLTQVIDDCVSHQKAARAEEVRSAVAVAIKEVFDNAGAEFVHLFSAQADGILSTYQRRVDALVEKVRRTAAEMFDVSFAHEAEPEAFRLAREPYWVTERVAGRLIPDFGWMIDRFLPAALRRQHHRARVIEQTSDLIIRNAESLRWAVLAGLDETFRAATAQVEARLAEVLGATKGIIEEVLERRRDRSMANEEGLDRLEQSMEALAKARGALLASNSGTDN